MRCCRCHWPRGPFLSLTNNKLTRRLAPGLTENLAEEVDVEHISRSQIMCFCNWTWYCIGQHWYQTLVNLPWLTYLDTIPWYNTLITTLNKYIVELSVLSTLHVYSSDVIVSRHSNADWVDLEPNTPITMLIITISPASRKKMSDRSTFPYPTIRTSHCSQFDLSRLIDKLNICVNLRLTRNVVRMGFWEIQERFLSQLSLGM